MAAEMNPDPNVPNTEHAWQSKRGTCLEELMRGLAWPFGKAVARVHVCAHDVRPRVSLIQVPHPNNPTKV